MSTHPEDLPEWDESDMPDEKPEEFKVPRSNAAPCPKCQTPGCEKHLIACAAPHLQALSDNHRLSLSELTKIFNEIELSDDDKKKLEDGGGITIGTGVTTEYEKMSEEEQEQFKGHMEGAFQEQGQEEEELPIEEGGDWNLPQQGNHSQKSGMQTRSSTQMAGMKIKYSDYEKVPALDPKNAEGKWFQLLAVEPIVTTNGHTTKLSIFRTVENPIRMSAAWREAQKIVPRLKRRLQMAFAAAAKVDKAKNKKKGHVDPQALTKLVTEKSQRVFFKKGDGKAPKTAVSISLDSSGSMGERLMTGAHITGDREDPEYVLHTKIGVAMTMALAFGEVCDQLDVAFEVVSYQYGGLATDQYAIIYKAFGEDWATVKNRLGYYRHNGGDVPYEALGWSLARLSTQPQERKVQFFISDANACNLGIEKCYDLAKYAKRKANIDTIGIGVMTDYMKQFMKEKSETVMDIKELTDTMFSRLVKIINPKPVA